MQKEYRGEITLHADKSIPESSQIKQIWSAIKSHISDRFDTKLDFI